MLILEEAAYISSNVIEEVMTPVLNVNYSAIIAISTPGKRPTAKFNMMLKSEYFHVHKVMFICERCYNDGVRLPCKHNRDFVPDHLGDNSDLVKSLFADNEEGMMRDVMGVMDDSGCSCFTERSVMNMMTLPRVGFYEPVRFVHVVADGCAGSRIEATRSSDFCLITSCGGGSHTTFLGAESFDAVTTQDYEPIIIRHLRKIRSMPMFANSTFVVDAESGTGFIAGDVQLLIQREFKTNIICMNELGRKPGTYTGGKAKREMMDIMRAHLDMGELRFFEHFTTENNNVNKMMGKIQTQLLNFEKVVTLSDSVNVSSKVTYSGKQHGPDDLAVTMQRALYDRHKFMFAPMYQQYLI